TVYNIRGEKVKTLLSKKMTEGYRYVTWDGTNRAGNSVASGLYLIRMQAGDPSRGIKHGISSVKKMILAK
ncbi:hypothetical protein GF337_20265, partial [candidate division KSB1 bacterium]|nr:hypothetical protein [candidate division KSB1 bacterium]